MKSKINIYILSASVNGRFKSAAVFVNEYGNKMFVIDSESYRKTFFDFYTAEKFIFMKCLEKMNSVDEYSVYLTNERLLKELKGKPVKSDTGVYTITTYNGEKLPENVKYIKMSLRSMWKEFLKEHIRTNK